MGKGKRQSNRTPIESMSGSHNLATHSISRIIARPRRQFSSVQPSLVSAATCHLPLATRCLPPPTTFVCKLLVASCLAVSVSHSVSPSRLCKPKSQRKTVGKPSQASEKKTVQLSQYLRTLATVLVWQPPLRRPFSNPPSAIRHPPPFELRC